MIDTMDLCLSVRRRCIAQRVQSGAGPLWSVLKPCRSNRAAGDESMIKMILIGARALPPTFAYPIAFFDVFFDLVFGRKLRGPKIILTSSKRPLGANMSDFGPQLGTPKRTQNQYF